MRNAQLSGRLGKDPEIVSTSSGWYCLKFSIANNDETKKNEINGYDPITSWFNLEYWTKKPEYWNDKLKKGVSICADCKPKENQWEQDGKKRSKIIFIIDKFPLILDHPTRTQAPVSTSPSDDFADDIPF